MENRRADPVRLAVLISGGGRTLANLQTLIGAGRLRARIVQVISSRADARGVSLSREMGLPVAIVERRCCTERDFQEAVTQAVRRSGADLVCMAGFLSLWRIPDDLLGRVINIHPALLPDFGGPGMYGHHVHAAVIAAARTESGCTVHFCDNEYDHGPVILQRRLSIPPGCGAEALADLVFEEEKLAYAEAIRLIAEGKVRWTPHGVVRDPTPS